MWALLFLLVSVGATLPSSPTKPTLPTKPTAPSSPSKPTGASPAYQTQYESASSSQSSSSSSSSSSTSNSSSTSVKGRPPKIYHCPPDEVYYKCRLDRCSNTCEDLRKPPICPPIAPGCIQPACLCKAGYYKNSHNKCVPAEQCGKEPSKCGYNEKPVKCRTICPPQNCDLPYTTYLCDKPLKCERGCDCLDGYWRNSSGICIPQEQCPGPTPVPICGYNEEPVPCRTICPPQNCDLPYTDYFCAQDLKCEPGCDCIADHFRNSSGICVPSKECGGITTEPPLSGKCSVNETEVQCKQFCPPQSCNASYTEYACNIPIVCLPGCNCKENYLRNASGICILNEECPPPTTTELPPSDCPPDEEYYKCRLDRCSNTCEDLIKPPICPPIAPGCIQPGCLCKAGYYRNSHNKCVPADQCGKATTTEPPPSGKCSVNETEVQCMKVCPPQSCNISYTEYNCNIPIACIPGCDCKENYLRNSSGICIFNEECPPPTTEPPPSGKCSVNETEAQCKQICPPQSCNISYTEYNCNIPIACTPGCDCKENYLRNSSGICILNEECPPPTTEPPLSGKCSVNETEVQCMKVCPPQSCNISYTEYNCNFPIACTPGCDCKENYLRNSSGICILNEECPPPPVIEPLQCGYNEEEVPCLRSCPPQLCDALYFDFPCAYKEGCDRGCACISGHLRNSSGICTPKDQCPPPPVKEPLPCGYNEVEVPCFRPCPPQSCDALYLDYLCAYQEGCDRGCACISGHLRNSSGYCVPSEKCPYPPWIIKPVPCGKNETYAECKQTCPPQSCNISYTSYLCPENQVCESGCDCKENYLRNSTGHCILNDECKPPTATVCRDDENYVQCKVNCSTNYCPVDDSRAFPLCEPTQPCDPGCTCKIGFKRKSQYDDSCIPGEECTPVPCTRQNEEWDMCPTPCLYEYCEDADKPPVTCNTLIKDCSPRCVCTKGHYRNASDICVPVSECPPVTTTPAPVTVSSVDNKCNNENETYVPCQFDCPTIFCARDDNLAILACSPPYPCPPGCVCKNGFKRKSPENRTCIPPEECPAVPCTRQNEVWNPCTSSCFSESCRDIYQPKQECFEKRQNCQPKCVCREGFYRNDSLICVPASECAQVITIPPVTEPPVTVTPITEPPVTVTPITEPPVTGTPITEPPVTGTPITEPPVTVTPITEPPVTGTPITEPPVTATPVTEPPITATPITEPPVTGTPITEPPVTVTPITEPPVECGPNQTIVDCTFKCPNLFCLQNDDQVTYACKPPRDCPSGCGCQMGYKYLSYDNLTCVLAQDCPPVECTRPNEEFSFCPSSCLAEDCENANDLPTFCAELLYRDCQPKCICKSGYYRNKSGICVLREDCITCGPNQINVPCNVNCPTEFCPTTDSRFQVACSVSYPCPIGCACKENYFKKSYENQTCILKQECPPVECTRQNEVFNPCAQSCLAESCQDVDGPKFPCADDGSCNPKCVCAEGFYRNEEDICVSKEECKKCKPNEQYVYCKAGCPTDYCLTDDSLAVVACDPPYPCPSGCICELNYKKLSYNNETCVPVQECPPVTCTRPHEVYNSCSSNCLSESCLDVDKPLSDCYNRTQYCVPKCVCEDGYYRNESEICVLKEDCKKCPPNERYVECKGYCQSDYCPSDNRPVTPCDDPSPYCSGGCVCNENYKRQSYDNSTCIPADECPPPTAQSPPTPGEPVPVAPTPPQEPISPPATQCGPNSSPISCDTKCSDLYCPTDDSLTPKPCPTPEPCSEGCICSLNYKKLSLANETCVVSSTCPEIPCTRENEEWCSCPSPCIRESCPDIYDQPTTCNYLVLNCQPRCICKKGYFRNETGFCVAINKCPEFHGGPFKLFQNCESSSKE